MIVSSTRTVSIVRDRLFVPVIGACIGHLSREEVGTRVLRSCPDLWRTAFTKDPDFVFALLRRTHLGLRKDTPLRRSIALGPSSPYQSCPDCIIATRGYDFRE
jgi:hypothetical protein